MAFIPAPIAENLVMSADVIVISLSFIFVNLYAGICCKIASWDKIYNIALLHDIGKIGIPDNIINKPGKLTDEEFKVIKGHTLTGAKILSEIKSASELIYGAKYHHERYDGKGYPCGLKGEEIPEISAIIAVADAYDAMTSNRSYRKLLPREYETGNRERSWNPV